ncbi:MAG: MFS transporter [Hyphomicrobiales bacterium]
MSETGHPAETEPKFVAGWPPRVILLVGSVCLTYVVSQFLRNSVGVIAPNLSAELSLSPEGISLLAGAFFFSFAAAQFPLGVALDRWGPKAAMLASIGLAVVGCLMFAWATSLSGLVSARIVMGLGCSSFFMAPLTLFSRWFAPERFSTLTGIQLGFGSFGTLLATGPLAGIAATMGWRTAFLGFAALSVVAGLTVLFVVRDDPPGSPPAERPQESFLSGMISLLEVARAPSFWPVFALHLILYSCFASVLGLWGGPFLTDVYGLDLAGRGHYLLLLAAGQIAGLFLWGPSDRLFRSRKRPVMLGVALTIGMIALLGLWGRPPQWFLSVWFPVFGFFSAVSPVLVSQAGALYPAVRRPRHHDDECRHHGRRVRHAGGDRLCRRPVRRHRRVRHRPAGGGLPGGVPDHCRHARHRVDVLFAGGRSRICNPSFLDKRRKGTPAVRATDAAMRHRDSIFAASHNCRHGIHWSFLRPRISILLQRVDQNRLIDASPCRIIPLISKGNMRS